VARGVDTVEDAAVFVTGEFLDLFAGIIGHGSTVDVEAADADLGGHALGGEVIVDAITVRVPRVNLAGMARRALAHGVRCHVAELHVAGVEVPALALDHGDRPGCPVHVQHGADALVLRDRRASEGNAREAVRGGLAKLGLDRNGRHQHTTHQNERERNGFARNHGRTPPRATSKTLAKTPE
jgi:hypothetical protein